MKKTIALVSSLFFLYGCGDLDNPGGVLTANQLPDSVIQHIKDKNILSNEEIIAYYDVTISLDNSESAILTNKNIIYYKTGRINKIALNNVKSISQLEDCFGVCILIETNNNKTMKIDIAPFNGGDLFLQLLQSQTSNYL